MGATQCSEGCCVRSGVDGRGTQHPSGCCVALPERRLPHVTRPERRLPHVPTRRRGRAFTLLEVVLALGLTLGVTIASFVLYQQMARGRAQVIEEMEKLAAVRQLMSRMTAELQAVYHVPEQDAQQAAALSGSSGRIDMRVAALPELAAWMGEEADGRPASSDLRLVTYRRTSGGVERVEDRSGGVPMEGESRVASEAVIAPGVRFMQMRYHGPGGWQESWSGSAGQPPRAVEIRLGLEPLPSDMEPEDYPHRMWRRVVALPAAEPGPFVPATEQEEPDAGDEGGML